MPCKDIRQIRAALKGHGEQRPLLVGHKEGQYQEHRQGNCMGNLVNYLYGVVSAIAAVIGPDLTLRLVFAIDALLVVASAWMLFLAL